MPIRYRQAGDRYGRLAIVELGPERFLVRCDCGTEKTIDKHLWRQTKSCGCAGGRPKLPHELIAVRHVGQTFGRWTVLAAVRRKGANTVMFARCECGTEREVLMGNLITGMSRSCGCLARDLKRARRRPGSEMRQMMKNTWRKMLSRCYDIADDGFEDYGRRGIVVCKRWRESFEDFCADMGPRPSDGHSIDRENNDGPYSPGNCRWATQREQARNTRRNVWIEHNGERMLATDWAARLGLSRERIRQRLAKGLPVEQVVAAKRVPPEPPRYEHHGESLTLTEWSRRLGVGRQTLWERARRGLRGAKLFSLTPLPRHRPRRVKVTVARERKPYACRACGQTGHNKQTCANVGAGSVAA